MDRRQFLTLAALGLAAAGCGRTATSSSGTSGSGQKATIGLTYIPNVQFAPFYLAEDRKAFADRGVAATLRHHGAQEGLFDALLQGTEDVVLAGGDELLQARSGGADLVAIAAYFRRFPAEVIARADAGIAAAADLRGKRIGVPGRYGESWFALLAALASANLTEADVTITEIGYTAQAALASSKVDAVVGFANNDAVQLRLGGQAITEVSLGDAVPLVSACLVTRRSTLAERPEVLRSVVAAMGAGIAAAVADPAAAVTATSSRVPGMDAAALSAARATMDATAPLLAPNGTVDLHLDATAWDAMGTFMAAKGLIPAAVPASDAMTNELVA